MSEKKPLVYRVSIKDEHDVWCFVRAESPGQAKYAAMTYDQGDTMDSTMFCELRAERVSSLDADFSEMSLFATGRMWVECSGCGTQVNEGDEHCVAPEDDGTEDGDEVCESWVRDENGFIYCSERCKAESVQEHGPPRGKGTSDHPINGICLYADV